MRSVNETTPNASVHSVGGPVPVKVTALFIAVAVAQLLDLATFLPAVARVGIEAESNPIARTLFQLAGPVGPAAWKVTAIIVLLLALWRVVRRYPSFSIPTAALIVGIGLFGAASNVMLGLLR